MNLLSKKQLAVEEAKEIDILKKEVEALKE
jgi:hypothetical protein